MRWWSTLLLAAAACIGTRVPDVPPATAPEWVYADSNVLATPAFAGLRVPRNVVAVSFYPGTDADLKEGAFFEVRGILIGGMRLADSSAFYLIKIRGDRTGAAVTRAIRTLNRLPQVFVARIAVPPDRSPP